MNKILVAVSGGPDSMALLHQLLNQKFEIIVVHVNYNLRKSAMRDQKIVEDFCNKHQLILEVHEASPMQKGNFQAYARKVRYDFFEAMGLKYEVEDVYLAHHLDDHLETYLMQKMRDSTPFYYGIQAESEYGNLRLIRPLLDVSKENLIRYCEHHRIEYGIDESNFENTYERNRIRNTILKGMSKEDKLKLKQECEAANEQRVKEHAIIAAHVIAFKRSMNISDLVQYADSEIINVLRMFLLEYDLHSVSHVEYQNILNFLRAQGNGEYKLSDKLLLSKAYGKLDVVLKAYKYAYVYHDLQFETTPYFKTMRSGKSVDAVTLSADDFPITIRNYEAGDKIKLRFGSKSVNRYFIDRKIPVYQRKVWPIVTNRNGEIILVPGLGCNVTHYSNNPTVFVVK